MVLLAVIAFLIYSLKTRDGLERNPRLVNRDVDSLEWNARPVNHEIETNESNNTITHNTSLNSDHSRNMNYRAPAQHVRDRNGHQSEKTLRGSADLQDNMTPDEQPKNIQASLRSNMKSGALLDENRESGSKQSAFKRPLQQPPQQPPQPPKLNSETAMKSELFLSQSGEKAVQIQEKIRSPKKPVKPAKPPP